MSSGIPQGSVLGPVLFLIFINDFPDVIEVLLKLFADDAKVYNIISNLNDVHPLQRRVDNAGRWSIDCSSIKNVISYMLDSKVQSMFIPWKPEMTLML